AVSKAACNVTGKAVSVGNGTSAFIGFPQENWVRESDLWEWDRVFFKPGPSKSGEFDRQTVAGLHLVADRQHPHGEGDGFDAIGGDAAIIFHAFSGEGHGEAALWSRIGGHRLTSRSCGQRRRRR